jgi:hypothetical protein
MRLKAICLTLLLAMMAGAEAWAQCSMCRAVTNSNMQNDDFVGTGLNPAIIYLMILPYVLLSVIAFVFFRKQIMQRLRALFG